jgi:hypothetical protein
VPELRAGCERKTLKDEKSSKLTKYRIEIFRRAAADERPEATDCRHTANAIVGIALAQVHAAIGDIAVDDDGKDPPPSYRMV